MNPKIDKVTNEIEKTRQKIAELQQRAEELDRQRTDLENTEIVLLCRSADIPLAELAKFFRSCKTPGEAVQRAQLPAYSLSDVGNTRSE